MTHQTTPSPITSGEALRKLTDEQYYEILQPVLPPYYMQRYLNGDQLTMHPIVCRAIIDRALASTEAAITPSGEITWNEAVLLAGIQAVCIAGRQECARQGGTLSEWDKGWLLGQLHIFDMYTSVEKSAIADARAYIEKLAALAANALRVAPSVEIATWLERMPPQRKQKYCSMNCSPRNESDCDDCGTETIHGSPIAARDAEIADLRAALAQRASAPDEAVAMRDAALEEAAEQCDELHDTWRWDDEADSASGPRSCAAAIRALKSKQPADGGAA